MSSRGIATSGERFNALQRAEEVLSYRTDIKISLGCGATTRELSDVQARVFAQTYGVFNSKGSTQIFDHLFRWLLAHTGDTKYDFNPQKTHQQWRNIIKHYFQANGYYAELAIAERILLAILRGKNQPIQTDLFAADRMADRDLATDWICHRHLPKGRLNLGIQVAASNRFNSKIFAILDRVPNDLEFFSKGASPVVTQFLRHGNAVMAFGDFKPTENIRGQGLESLLGGKRLYQSKIITMQNPSFEQYGKWVLDILNCLHESIITRSVHIPGKSVREFHFITMTKEGHELRVKMIKVGKEPLVTIEFFPGGIRANGKKPIQFALPIGRDFLDIYRDKAGIPAKS